MGPYDDEGSETRFVTIEATFKIRCDKEVDPGEVARHFVFAYAPRSMEGVSQRFGRIALTTMGVGPIRNYSVEEWTRRRYAKRSGEDTPEAEQEG